jgi:hypothetical protein
MSIYLKIEFGESKSKYYNEAIKFCNYFSGFGKINKSNSKNFLEISEKELLSKFYFRRLEKIIYLIHSWKNASIEIESKKINIVDFDIINREINSLTKKIRENSEFPFSLLPIKKINKDCNHKIFNECYPPIYGFPIAWKCEQCNAVFLCSCHEKAMNNFFTNENKIIFYNENLKYFPIELLEYYFNFENGFDFNYIFKDKETKAYHLSINSDHYSVNSDPFHYLDKICHICSDKVSSHYYCNPMYGSVIAQRYGSYIKKEIYESKNNLFEKEAENIVRAKIGYFKIGGKWKSETILYTIVQNLFSNYKIKRHFRPKWLEGLELDIYVDELNLGIEYQGQQHFSAIGKFGGEEGLKKVQERDKRKKEICDNVGIKLLYFLHNEFLSSELVSKKINNATGLIINSEDINILPPNLNKKLKALAYLDYSSSKT